MNTKKTIRTRRQKRIQNLLESEESKRDAELYQRISASGAHEWAQNKRELDPEKIWKQRQKLIWEQYSKEGSQEYFKSISYFSWFRLHCLISLLLLGLMWLMFQIKEPWAIQGQEWVRTAMTESIDFKKMEAWYAETFDGSPSFIPIWNGRDKEIQQASTTKLQKLFLPVDGHIVSSFSQEQKGVYLISDSNEVKALDTGRVIYSDRSEQLGWTVIIQHANQLKSIYANLAESPLQEDDWVEGGSVIGTALVDEQYQTPLLFFSVMKEEAYIDPAEVVTFD